MLKKNILPTVIIRNSKDMLTNVSSACKIRQSLKNGELFITHGNRYTHILTMDNAIEHMVLFLTKN